MLWYLINITSKMQDFKVMSVFKTFKAGKMDLYIVSTKYTIDIPQKKD